jgi:chromosome segregation ATPase
MMSHFMTVFIAALMMITVQVRANDSSDPELNQIEAEKSRLNGDIKKIEGETAATEKVVADNRSKIEKAKAELQTLQQMKSEKAGNFLMLANQRDKLLEEMKKVEEEKLQAEKEFQAAKEQDKKAQQEFEQTKIELAKNKARLEAYVAGLKDRYREMQERKKSMFDEQQTMERQNAKLEAKARAGEAELQPRQPAAASSPAPEVQAESLKLKKSCRVFDSPTKGSKVITVQEGGTSITKSEEGKTWFSFSMADGRKGYIAKTCF